jgi:hypothetical protein
MFVSEGRSQPVPARYSATVGAAFNRKIEVWLQRQKHSSLLVHWICDEKTFYDIGTEINSHGVDYTIVLVVGFRQLQ